MQSAKMIGTLAFSLHPPLSRSRKGLSQVKIPSHLPVFREKHKTTKTNFRFVLIKMSAPGIGQNFPEAFESSMQCERGIKAIFCSNGPCLEPCGPGKEERRRRRGEEKGEREGGRREGGRREEICLPPHFPRVQPNYLICIWG